MPAVLVLLLNPVYWGSQRGDVRGCLVTLHRTASDLDQTLEPGSRTRPVSGTRLWPGFGTMLFSYTTEWVPYRYHTAR